MIINKKLSIFPLYLISFLYFCKLIDNKNIKSKTMPKLKTKSGAKKRFALTGTGKIKRKNAFKSHILTKKETKQKRNLTQTSYVADVDTKSVLRQLAIK